MDNQTMPARWWRCENDHIVCELCPRHCHIAEGGRGFCRMRRNEANQLVADSYGYPLSLAIDPIEKKPLFHFLPGSKVLSFGTPGCTLACRFCQNWSLSQKAEPQKRQPVTSPSQLIEFARREQVPTIAFTYNEPTVFGEYLIDVSREARQAGIRNVMVSNGYVAKAARCDMYQFIDGVNIDLKGFTEAFYRDQTGGDLKTVLDTLTWVAGQQDIWLEITTLLIPGLNDDDAQLTAQCRWIVEALGRDVPLHLTAFHPDYKMKNRPRTSAAVLAKGREIALNAGLRYVYTGNVVDDDGQRTHCGNCGNVVITRHWHHCNVDGLRDGVCCKCDTPVAGVFE
jgi:pyruvate formate lyase activating enzyme